MKLNDYLKYIEIEVSSDRSIIRFSPPFMYGNKTVCPTYVFLFDRYAIGLFYANCQIGIVI